MRSMSSSSSTWPGVVVIVVMVSSSSGPGGPLHRRYGITPDPTSEPVRRSCTEFSAAETASSVPKWPASQVEVRRQPGELETRAHAELGVRVREVGLHGPLPDEQALADVARREPVDRERRDFP